MKTCPRCGYSFVKDTNYCHKCGYDALNPSLSRKKQSVSKGKIIIGAIIILGVVLITMYVGFYL